jgi:hypothetical protein
MGDSVKYQIEKAEHALRSALELGAMHEDPYTLHSLVEALQKLGYIIAVNKVKAPSDTFNVEGGIPFATNYDDIINFGGDTNLPEINLIT